MAKNNFNFPAGLSWGIRGFRIGKSAYGNWWLSIRLPLGFRYLHIFKNKKAGVSITSHNQQQSNKNVIDTPSLATPSLMTIDKKHSKIKNRT